MDLPGFSTRLCHRALSDTLVWRSDRAITTRQFLSDVATLASHAPGTGPAINLCTDRYHFMAAFVAAFAIGRHSLLPANQSPDHLQALLERYPGAWKVDESDSADLRTRGMPWGQPNKHTVGAQPVDPERTAAIIFTSGSTGEPSAHPKTWGELVQGARINASVLLDGIPLPVNLLATVPTQHMWGLETSVMLPLFARVAVSNRTPFFPADVAQALTELAPPRILVSTPLHLSNLLASGQEFPACARVLSATAPMAPDLARRVERALDTELLEIFGCSEAGVCATRYTARESDWTLMPGFSLEPHADGCSIKAPHLGSGAVIADRLSMTGERSFRWDGRNADQVKIAGKRASLADLNIKLLSVPGVLDGVLFLPSRNSERLAGLVVAPGLAARDICRVMGEGVDPVFLPRPLLILPELPRNASGKLPRGELERLWQRLRSGDVEKP